MPIERAELDRLQKDYKDAVNHWRAAIREEEALATPDHSVVAWDRWDEASSAVKEAGQTAEAAREAYKDGLRQLNYNF